EFLLRTSVLIGSLNPAVIPIHFVLLISIIQSRRNRTFPWKSMMLPTDRFRRQCIQCSSFSPVNRCLWPKKKKESSKSLFPPEKKSFSQVIPRKLSVESSRKDLLITTRIKQSVSTRTSTIPEGVFI